MLPEIQKIFSVWEQSGVLARKKAELQPLQIEEIEGSVFTSGPSYYYILDLFDFSLSHVSASIEEIHGLDPGTVTFKDILNQIHPDDMNHVSKAEAYCGKCFMKDSKLWDNVTSYKLCYSFRFKTKDGAYKLFLHQAITISVDEEGRTSSALNIHTDVSHLTTENNRKVSFIGLRGNPSFMNLSYDDPHNTKSDKPHFTKREVEIIKLIADGKDSAVIANLLGIAKETVKNHRKNILHKANCNNMSQLVKLSVANGLI